MTNYKCSDCGAEFIESEIGIYTEQVPYGNAVESVEWSCCPGCKGGDYEEVEEDRRA